REPASGEATRDDAGRAEQAAWLLGLAEATRAAIGTVIAPCEAPQHQRSVAAAKAVLGEPAFASAWQRGAAASDPDEFAPTPREPSPPASPAPPADSQALSAAGPGRVVLPPAALPAPAGAPAPEAASGPVAAPHGQSATPSDPPPASAAASPPALPPVIFASPLTGASPL